MLLTKDSFRIYLAGIFIVAAGLSGCTTTPTVDIRTECLPSPVYALADQQEFAKELRALDPVKNKQIVRFLGDYHAMRQADATCKAVSARGSN